jgi:hypothetical protein
MPEFNDRSGNAGTGNGVVRQIGYSTIRGVKHTFTPNEKGGWDITHPHSPETWQFVQEGTGHTGDGTNVPVTDLAEAKKAARDLVLAPDMRKPRKKGK